MYKTATFTQQSAQKIIKTDSMLMQRLLNAVIVGRSVELESILKHKLPPFLLSLIKLAGQMHLTPKSNMIKILTTGRNFIFKSIKNKHKSCMLLYGYALIQTSGKPSRCQTFGTNADVLLRTVTRYFSLHAARTDITFERYIGDDSINAGT